MNIYRRCTGVFIRAVKDISKSLGKDGEANENGARPNDLAQNAANIKAASYFLGVDAVGLSRCPDWAWYSHDATGAVLDPPHNNAVSMIIDQ